MSIRRIAGLILAAAAAGAIAPAAQAAPTGLELTGQADKAVYAVGEPVRLHFQVTNRTTSTCNLVSSGDGALSFTAVNRDGATTTWTARPTSYRSGFAAFLSHQEHPVAPGQQVDFTIEGTTLSTVGLLPSGTALTTDWDAGKAGVYQVHALYQVPAASKNDCAGLSARADVSFRIGQSSTVANVSHLLWWIAVPVALAVVLLLFLLVRRRKRRVVAGALLIGLLVAAGGQSLRPAPASADGDFGAAASGCLDKFNQPGGDPANILDAIDKAQKDGTFGLYPTDQSEGDRTDPDPPKRPREDGTTPPTGAKVGWNPNDKTALKDDPDIQIDNCANLYHELVHAADWLKGTRDDSPCQYAGSTPGGQASVAESKATLYENAFRASQHDTGSRTSYSGLQIPPVTGSVAAAIEGCHPKPEPDKGETGDDDDGDVLDAIARWFSDPHLVSFDGQRYDFQAVGEFVGAKSGTDLEIQVRQAPYPDVPGRQVAITSAIAVRVGADRIEFDSGTPRIAVLVNGKPGKLPASVVRRDSATVPGQDSYRVTWPDRSAADIDFVGVPGMGLRMGVKPAAARKGTFTGLLGNFDGAEANDGAPGKGAATDKVRISQAGSLFTYAPSQSTATFTDKSYPDKPIRTADLPQWQQEQAAIVCSAAGVRDPRTMTDCQLDVGLTGRSGFAIDAAAAQPPVANTPSTTPAPTQTPGPAAGGVIKDGQLVSGSIDKADQEMSFQVDLAGSTQFEIVDATDGVTVSLAEATNRVPALLPGPHQFGVAKTGTVKVSVALQANGQPATGKFQFRVVTLKVRKLTVPAGGAVTGRIDVPGRVDIYTFKPTGSTVSVNSDQPCDDPLSYGYADPAEPEIRTPGQLCFDYDQAVEPGQDKAVVIWSDDTSTHDYRFTLKQG
ncbi:VWD domain-containing protein [Kribbella sp. NBC_01505]|uniref:VWD domain-containing protein n=1 Tax=Kribbella sp. NBC_01505 TaxID=2903580 RepID=UPI00386C241A